MALRLAGSALLLAEADSDRASGYRVKAAFLLNFTKFVDRPESAFTSLSAPFHICIVGDDPFGKALDKMPQNDAAGAHRPTVRRVRQAEAGSCHLIFVRKSGKPVEEMLSTLGAGVLTVGESELFLRDGGTINFVIENRRVRFDINPGAAEAAELKVSSKSIKIARSVDGKATER